MEKIKLKLAKPITDQDGRKLSELEFREPTAADLIAVGDIPFTMGQKNGEQVVKIAPQASLELIAHCTGIHAPLLKALSARDFMEAQGILMGFFSGAATSLPETPSK